MPMFSKILVPVAFSARCEGAAQYAEALACHFHSELVLLHVVPPVPTYWCPDAVVMSPEVTADAVEQSKAELDKFLGDGLKGISVTRVVQEGDPAQRIVEFAHSGDFNLIVMPTHGYGPFRRFLLGSVTAKALHDLNCPVWTGPHLENAPAWTSITLRRIACAVDFGAQTRAVLNWGAALAAEFGARMVVLHAIPSAASMAGGLTFDPDLQNRWENDVRERIAAFQEELGFRASVRIESGDVPTAISAAACAERADLLVIGRSHGAAVWGRLRANAYALLRESPCPVISL